MAITHFKISKNTERVVIQKNGSPIVLDQAYPIAEQNEISIVNGTGTKSESIDNFKYQLSIDNGNTWSNEATCSIDDLVGTETPGSVNETINETDEDQENQLVLDINENTDRIIFLGSAQGNARLFLDNEEVDENEIIFVYDFSLLRIKNYLGGGEPYDQLNYRCANHLGVNTNDLYNVVLNVQLLAEANFVERSFVYGNVVIDNVNYYTVNVIDKILISKAYLDKLLKNTIEIDSPMLTQSIHNSVSVDLENRTANETFFYYRNADDKGQALIDVVHSYVDFLGVSTSSEITLTLDEVDEDPLKVSATNSHISTVSIVGFTTGASGTVSSYRSVYELNGDIYAGFLDDGTAIIKKNVNGVVTTANGVTDLETDWNNRYSLTYF